MRGCDGTRSAFADLSGERSARRRLPCCPMSADAPPPGRLSRTAAGIRRWFRPPRRLKFSRAGWLFTGGTLVLGFAAIGTGNNLLYLVLGAMLGFITLSGWLSEQMIRRWSVRRRPVRGLTAGQLGRITYDLRNNKRRLPSLAVEIGEAGREGRAWVAALDAGEAATARADALFPTCGVYPLETVTLATSFPFGLFRKERDLEIAGEAVVWPRHDRVLREPRLAGERIRRAGESFAGAAGARGEYRGLRPFRPGDDPRDVHWRTTARMGHPVVREYERDRSTALWICLDLRAEPARRRRSGGGARRRARAAAVAARASPSRWPTAERAGGAGDRARAARARARRAGPRAAFRRRCAARWTRRCPRRECVLVTAARGGRRLGRRVRGGAGGQVKLARLHRRLAGGDGAGGARGLRRGGGVRPRRWPCSRRRWCSRSSGSPAAAGGRVGGAGHARGRAGAVRVDGVRRLRAGADFMPGVIAMLLFLLAGESLRPLGAQQRHAPVLAVVRAADRRRPRTTRGWRSRWASSPTSALAVLAMMVGYLRRETERFREGGSCGWAAASCGPPPRSRASSLAMSAVRVPRSSRGCRAPGTCRAAAAGGRRGGGLQRPGLHRRVRRAHRRQPRGHVPRGVSQRPCRARSSRCTGAGARSTASTARRWSRTRGRQRPTSSRALYARALGRPAPRACASSAGRRAPTCSSASRRCCGCSRARPCASYRGAHRATSPSRAPTTRSTPRLHPAAAPPTPRWRVPGEVPGGRARACSFRRSTPARAAPGRLAHARDSRRGWTRCAAMEGLAARRFPLHARPAGRGREAVDRRLPLPSGATGHCEYFSTAMAVLLRARGDPGAQRERLPGRRVEPGRAATWPSPATRRTPGWRCGSRVRLGALRPHPAAAPPTR